jgi:hypothetical protein
MRVNPSDKLAACRSHGAIMLCRSTGANVFEIAGLTAPSSKVAAPDLKTLR